MSGSNDSKAKVLTPKAWQRVESAVLKVEAGEDVTDLSQGPNGNKIGARFKAELTASNYDTTAKIWKYSWTQVKQITDSWATNSDGFSGTYDGANYAIEMQGLIASSMPQTAAPDDLIVEMEVIQVWDAGSNTWKPSYRFFRTTINIIELLYINSSSVPTGGGIYNANICAPPDADIDPSSTLTSSDVAKSAGDGEAVIALNIKEIGSAKHDLTDDGTNTDLYAIGIYRHTNSDGKKVYAIDKIWIGCEAGV